jgi:hypothetical protein
MSHCTERGASGQELTIMRDEVLAAGITINGCQSC